MCRCGLSGRRGAKIIVSGSADDVSSGLVSGGDGGATSSVAVSASVGFFS
ncbi:hypothetical protein [Escherichia coli IS5]|nr:hypothetical protein [Escherichia coli IS5]